MHIAPYLFGAIDLGYIYQHCAFIEVDPMTASELDVLSFIGNPIFQPIRPRMHTSAGPRCIRSGASALFYEFHCCFATETVMSFIGEGWPLTGTSFI